VALIFVIEFRITVSRWQLRLLAQNRKDPSHAEENRFTKSPPAVG
jgi:hypothetical protein